MLDLLFANRDGLVGDVVVGGRLGQNDHEIIEFSISGEVRRSTSKTLALYFRRADFGLFRRLIQSIPWEAALKNKGVQESWACLKTEILRAQEQTVPVCRKVSRRGKPPAWMSKEVLEELRNKKRMYQLWKGGQVSQEVFKGAAKTCRKKIREAKAQFELRMATSVKDNKKCFYKYINAKRKSKTNLCSLLDKGGNLISADEEKAEVLNAYFASVFSEETTCLQDNCPPGLVDGVREQNGPLIIQEEAVRELLTCLDIHKSMRPDRIHPRVMRELADELAKPLSIIYQESWLTGEVPDDWKLANETPIHKKGGTIPQETTGQENTGRETTPHETTTQETTPHETTLQEMIGQETSGQESTGQETILQESTGQESTPLEPTGKKLLGKKLLPSIRQETIRNLLLKKQLGKKLLHKKLLGWKLLPEKLLGSKLLGKKLLPTKVLPKKLLGRKLLIKKLLPKKLLSQELLPKQALGKKLLPKKQLSKNLLPMKLLAKKLLPKMLLCKKLLGKKLVPKKLLGKKLLGNKHLDKNQLSKKLLSKKLLPRKQLGKNLPPKKLLAKKLLPRKLLGKKYPSENYWARNYSPRNYS
ncbi:hypothetical protein DUI87_35598 [Hirundo rustica rustica]|uniref:Endonuclease/exonuclease/phosphatase domain-containing protein n=1 Tax=Hirundo rustica rustica TaxID=333673 RepID=A0A3M0IES9_HIRRU|nr:hypothetical protein DUI87_35598 [Hirundo rustica rustica]